MSTETNAALPLAFRPSPEVLDALRRAAVTSGIDPDDGQVLGLFAGRLLAQAIPAAVDEVLRGPPCPHRRCAEPGGNASDGPGAGAMTLNGRDPRRDERRGSYITTGDRVDEQYISDR